jgi:hypothetical protein
LQGELVGGVLRAVAGDGVKVAVVMTDWYVGSDNRVAGLDYLEIPGVNSSFGSSRFVKKLDLLKETGLVVFVETGPAWGTLTAAKERTKKGLVSWEIYLR